MPPSPRWFSLSSFSMWIKSYSLSLSISVIPLPISVSLSLSLPSQLSLSLNANVWGSAQISPVCMSGNYLTFPFRLGKKLCPSHQAGAPKGRDSLSSFRLRAPGGQGLCLLLSSGFSWSELGLWLGKCLVGMKGLKHFTLHIAIQSLFKLQCFNVQPTPVSPTSVQAFADVS